ncbi:X-Pro dipeptidyl-peptidase [Williamsia sp. 1138]|uniref:CocE/NonD family hydrolase n=1 Tax=Williamsia sp. 1138 TaxID=1903117 RepID=UPI000B9B962C|nr:CocE/NonD family hydrolase [Williamsia sp. 1138]OZG26130.1 X-Pro dipeptidyl-peptidase [Williamsia sp. 1138]
MTKIVVEFDMAAVMRDGTVLRADIYRPDQEGPWPVLLSRMPYGKGAPSLLAMLEPTALAKQGFIVVLQDTRGRFSSDGDWEPWTHEEQDGYDSVQWAATLPDSNGSVGMYGSSYLGNAQWMAALSRPPALKAIAPQVTWSDPDDGLFSRGGALELGLSLPWSLAQGIDTVMRRHAADGPAVVGDAVAALVKDLDEICTTAYWETPADHHPAFVRHDIRELGFEHSRREPGWAASCRVAGRYQEVEVPSLIIAGWWDCFGQGSLDNFTEARAAGRPANLIVGPWPHPGPYSQVGDTNFGLGASGDLMGFRGRLIDIQSRWLRQWLAPDAVDAEPPAVQGALPPVLLFVMGSNQWREESEWPLARAVETSWFLRADGRLTQDSPLEDEGSSHYSYNPHNPVPTTGGSILMSSEFRAGPMDQAVVEARPDVTVFTSEQLTADLEVTGRVRATLHAVTDAETTDWVVRLCDVDPTGTSTNVVDGILRVDTRPDEYMEHIIDLWSTSYVFRAGHRVRVQVTSSNFPRWDRNTNARASDGTADQMTTAAQGIGHDAVRRSFIVLPIIPDVTEA